MGATMDMKVNHHSVRNNQVRDLPNCEIATSRRKSLFVFDPTKMLKLALFIPEIHSDRDILDHFPNRTVWNSFVLSYVLVDAGVASGRNQ